MSSETKKTCLMEILPSLTTKLKYVLFWILRSALACLVWFTILWVPQVARYKSNWHSNIECCTHWSTKQTGSPEIVLDSTPARKPGPLSTKFQDQDLGSKCFASQTSGVRLHSTWAGNHKAQRMQSRTQWFLLCNRDIVPNKLYWNSGQSNTQVLF